MKANAGSGCAYDLPSATHWIILDQISGFESLGGSQIILNNLHQTFAHL